VYSEVLMDHGRNSTLEVAGGLIQTHPVGQLVESSPLKRSIQPLSHGTDSLHDLVAAAPLWRTEIRIDTGGLEARRPRLSWERKT